MKPRMRLSFIALIAAVALSLNVAFAFQSSSTGGSAKLLQLEADFMRATAERGLDGFMSYFADDAVTLPDGGGIASGKEEIRRALSPWGSDVSLTWIPLKAYMAASGDLGYTYGTYVFKANGKDGNPVTHRGKYTTIWKKQSDGSWKAALDIGNSSPDK